MSKRQPPAFELREFQRQVKVGLVAVGDAALAAAAAAPRQRWQVARTQGAALLSSPTGSGKTVVLAAAADELSRRHRLVWFWFSPFAGTIPQARRRIAEASDALRPRDPVKDRAAEASRPGDVFLATWAVVSAQNAKTRRVRRPDDVPTLDALIAALRDARYFLGAVVDESHHSFRKDTEALKFYAEVLRPDLTFMATATPRDRDVEEVSRRLGLANLSTLTVSRASVVSERLNKPSVRAVSFVARGRSRNLVSVDEVALRKAWEHHAQVRAELETQGLPLRPLLLVQAASDEWTPAKIRTFLIEELDVPETAVAVHTSSEPNAQLQELAEDDAVEVLIFKMAVATGFDAPRAFTLCSLRASADPEFGLQVIGRIMRVHRLLQPRETLPAILQTGAVFLGDPAAQPGLQEAANRIRLMRDGISLHTDRGFVVQVEVKADGTYGVVGENGQFEVFTELPPLFLPSVPGTDTRADEETEPMLPGLFGRRQGRAGSEARRVSAGQPGSGGVRRALIVPPEPATGGYRYHRRTDLPVPRLLRTERMPTQLDDVYEQFRRELRLGAEQIVAAQAIAANVERYEAELFENAVRRVEDKAHISNRAVERSAQLALSFSDWLDPSVLAEVVKERLVEEMKRQNQPLPDDRTARRATHILLARDPKLLQRTMLATLARSVEVVDAEPLPETVTSDVALERSPLNAYGVYPLSGPSTFNTWERRFAEWLDAREGDVLWWLRNAQRSSTKDAWGVKIVLPDGQGYYPDFVVGVRARGRASDVRLAETKRDFASAESERKLRSEHREYGTALMLYYDQRDDRLIRVAFDEGAGRSRIADDVRIEDLIL